MIAALAAGEMTAEKIESCEDYHDFCEILQQFLLISAKDFIPSNSKRSFFKKQGHWLNKFSNKFMEIGSFPDRSLAG